jgi:uncharacterized protein YdeI (YjbR/CyaY-like superfamily)
MSTDQLFFENAQAFRAWLKSNAASASELLLAYHKVATGRASVSYSESVDEALCFGWIDGVRRRVDAEAYLIRFTPRQPSSIWSTVNIAKVQRLRAQRRMTAAGERAFARRSEARSAIYAHEQVSVAQMSLPEHRMFKRNRVAWRFFQAAPPGYQRQVLHWVNGAKKAETRASRLSKLVAACSASQRLFGQSASRPE